MSFVPGQSPLGVRPQPPDRAGGRRTHLHQQRALGPSQAPQVHRGLETSAGGIGSLSFRVRGVKVLTLLSSLSVWCRVQQVTGWG